MDGQKGLVSALAYGSTAAGQGNLLAVGTYSPGTIFIYDQRAGPQPSGKVMRDGHCVVSHTAQSEHIISNKRKRFGRTEQIPRSNSGSGESVTNDDDETSVSWLSSAKRKWFGARTRGGVTQLQFSNGNNREFLLYSTSRRSNAVLAWDLRCLSDQEGHESQPSDCFGSASYTTYNDTNQRLEFDLDETGATLFVCGNDECVRVYSTETGSLRGVIDGLGDAANGVSYGRFPSSMPGKQEAFLAVTTGSRHFPSELDLDSESPGISRPDTCGSILLYKV